MRKLSTGEEKHIEIDYRVMNNKGEIHALCNTNSPEEP
jgi:hypothetical protein